MSPRTFLFGALLAAAACGADRGDSGGTPVDLEPRGDVVVVPPPTPGDGVRPRRRMDIDQLSASFARVTGGVNWWGWEPYARTLGKPDYAVQTHEDLSASLLFHKFLDDAARDVCDQLALREPGVPRESRALLALVEPTDTLETAPAAVRENLAMLLLRFHGRRVAPDDPLLAPWERLFGNVVTGTGNPVAGWRAVCVALIEHPDFTSY
jgi:hypothetical protein